MLVYIRVIECFVNKVVELVVELAVEITVNLLYLRWRYYDYRSFILNTTPRGQSAYCP
jgi:hypothetical protein